MLAAGGIPQGDCAPAPWMLSSRGYGIWVVTDSNGALFDLAGERVSVSTRASAGPLRVEVLCASTPASRLRAFCRRTGFPSLLPEWGYGFWKSRDVHEHQDDVLDDFHGFRRCEIPLDAIVIDSPWATQYNTWEFNPYQFPDAPGMISMLRADGVRTVVWCTPWVNLDSRDGYYIPDDASLADGRSGASAAWALGGLHRVSLQRALDEVHPESGVLFGRSGWTGQHAVGFTWGGDQASDFWSLRVLVVATLAAAASGYSNWSHDVGGYLGHRLVERCPPEPLRRWLQFGCFTPPMPAHARMAPGT